MTGQDTGSRPLYFQYSNTTALNRRSQTSSLFQDEKAEHAKEIERLRKIEDEILEDIRNGKYEQALAKAALLHYTAGYSSSAGKEWDAKRVSLPEQLNKLVSKE